MRLRDSLTGELREVEPGPDAQDRRLRLRPDDLRPDPCRERAAGRGVPPDEALPGVARPARTPRPEHHRHQRQDLRRRPGEGRPIGRAGGRDGAGVHRGHRPARPREARRRAAGERDDPRDRRADRGAHRRGARLRGGRRRLLRRQELRPLRRALGPASRRGRVRRAGRAGGAQARPGRLRALEGDEGRRGHVVALTVGRRPPGLAHRVLGDGREAPRARVRRARRRARPDLPPPRERDRAVVLDRPSLCADLGAQRAACGSPARRCRSRRATSTGSQTRSTAGGPRR